jgi:hypothetical protein
MTLFCLLTVGSLHPSSDLPLAGLSVARQIAMVSYRTAKGYHGKFGRAKDSSGVFQARSYLAYQVWSTSVLYPPFLTSSYVSSSFYSRSSSFLCPTFPTPTILSFPPPPLVVVLLLIFFSSLR